MGAVNLIQQFDNLVERTEGQGFDKKCSRSAFSGSSSDSMTSIAKWVSRFITSPRKTTADGDSNGFDSLVAYKVCHRVQFFVAERNNPFLSESAVVCVSNYIPAVTNSEAAR